MFYPTYQRVSPFCIAEQFVNLDQVCDLIPVVSTITNVTRISLSIFLSTTYQVCNMGLACIFTLKCLGDWTLRIPQAHLKNFQDFAGLSYRIKTIWTRSLFSFCFFNKSISCSLIHAIPLAGNLHAYFQKIHSDNLPASKKLSQRLIKEIESFKSWKLSIKSLPLIFPKYSQVDLDVIVNQIRVNPYQVKQVPKQLFQDQSFTLRILKTMTEGIAPQDLESDQRGIKELFESVFICTHEFGLFQEIPVPLEQLYMKSQLPELITKYPFLLWAISNRAFYLQKKYIAPLIHEYPHIVVCLTHHFLKLHPTILHKAISLNPKIVKYFEEQTIIQAFSLKESLNTDPLFVKCCALKPLLKKRFQESLKRRELLKSLKFV